MNAKSTKESSNDSKNQKLNYYNILQDHEKILLKSKQNSPSDKEEPPKGL